MKKWIKYPLISIAAVPVLLVLGLIGLLLFTSAGRQLLVEELGLHSEPAPAPLPEGTAKHWHTMGNQLYKKGDYEGAAEKFSISIQKDPNLADAHYDYARARALSLQQDAGWDGCYEDLTDMFKHLRRAISLVPRYGEKVKTDPAFLNLRRYFFYHQLTGFDPTDRAQVEHIVTTVNWGADDQGAIGSGYGLQFSAGGKLTFRFLNWYLDPDTEELKHVTVNGAYSFTSDGIALRLDKPAFGSQEGIAILGEKGLTLNSGSLKELVFTDSISRCDP